MFNTSTSTSTKNTCNVNKQPPILHFKAAEPRMPTARALRGQAGAWQRAQAGGKRIVATQLGPTPSKCI